MRRVEHDPCNLTDRIGCAAMTPHRMDAGATLRHRDRVKRLKSADLAALSRSTLAYYEESADEFWGGTRSHDVSQNRDALLGAIPGRGPHRILDLGCGPGRDLRAFRESGHDPVGLDGAEAFVRMARAYAGVEVWQQDFLGLDLPDAHFDGVFANASLFHVPLQELPRVLSELYACLKPGGVLFSSNPRGHNEESWSGRRYGAYHDYTRWRDFVTTAGFAEVRHYYRPTRSAL
jgi:SAM-dependent methyltransferase